jgi:ribosomal protein S12 methylthiotransferase accessory factor YcaO
MKIIVEYMNHLNESGIPITPQWLVESGHFFNEKDKTWIGAIDHIDNRSYFVPDNIVALTKQQLVDRCLSLDVFVTDLNTGQSLDKLEVETYISTWYDAVKAENPKPK